MRPLLAARENPTATPVERILERRPAHDTFLVPGTLDVTYCRTCEREATARCQKAADPGT